jgi:peptidoglycan/LPS O-acetylase OafA/YrhL
MTFCHIGTLHHDSGVNDEEVAMALPMMAPPAHAHWPALDGLRGIAILVVLGMHAHLPLLAGGYLGVDIFFVLSGFLITTVLVGGRKCDCPGRRGVLRTYRAFFVRRLGRLAPALLLSMLVVSVWAGFAGVTASARCTAMSLSYTMNLPWLEPEACLGPWHITWSLAAEEQFYVLWPWFVLVAGFSRRRLARVTLTAWCASAVMLIAGGLSGFIGGQVLNYSPVGRSCALLLGCSIALHRSTGHLRSGRWAKMSMGMSGVILMAIPMMVALAPWRPVNAVLAPFVACGAALVLMHVTHPAAKGVALACLNWAPLRRLGTLSYSLYLQHMVPLALLRVALPDNPYWAATAGLAIAAACAWVSFRFVEGPIRRRVNHRLAVLDLTHICHVPAGRPLPAIV